MDRAEKVWRINRATQDPKARQSLMEMIEEAPVAPKVEAPKKKVVKKKAKKKVLAPRSR